MYFECRLLQSAYGVQNNFNYRFLADIFYSYLLVLSVLYEMVILKVNVLA